MPLADNLRFASCELNVPARELWFDGQRQALAPKAFDMLLYLIEHRARVVSKDELLRHLWRGRVVSEGVLARSVMQVRKAIGDSGGAEGLIKTVHSVGYRFVGRLAAVSQDDAAPAAAERIRVCVLPIDNRTGEQRFDWVHLGLAALVCNALGARASLSVVDLTNVLFELRRLPPDGQPGEKAEALARALGAHCVVHGVLRWQARALWLDFQAYGEGGTCSTGALRGDEPSDLGLRMANQIADLLCPQGAEPLVFDSQDPFVNQVFGRASQLTAQYQFRAAAKFFDVVLELEPQNLRARLEYLRSLANGEDPRVLRVGAEFLVQAEQRGDAHLQAIGHAAIAHVLMMGDTKAAVDHARDHIEQAVRLAQPFEGSDWVTRIRLAQAGVIRLQGELSTAAGLLSGLQRQLSLSGGDRLNFSLVLDNLANAEADLGHLLKARNLLEEVLQLNRAHGLRSAAALTLMNLARVHARSGCLELAVQHAAASEQAFDSLQQPHAAASIAEAASEVYGELGAVEALDRVLSRLAPLCERPGLPPKSQWLTARARREMSAGSVEAARALFKRATLLAQRSGAHLRVRYRLMWWLELELRAAQATAVDALLAQMQALPGYVTDGELRAAVCRARAAAACRSGDLPDALRHLEDAARHAPAGRWRAMAILDAAWLDLSAQRLPQAAARLAEVAPWLEEHPLGQWLKGQLAEAEAAATRAMPSGAAGRAAASSRVPHRRRGPRAEAGAPAFAVLPSLR